TQTNIPVRVADVASVEQNVQPLYTMVSADGKPAVLLNINRQPYSNAVTVARESHDEVEKITKTLPPGIHMRPFYDQSIIVNASTITAIVVFLPLISMAGVEGVFFRALAITVAAALLTSLALAVTWTPNLSQYFISPHPRHQLAVPAAVEGNGDEISTERLLAAEEASLHGAFGRVVRFYERVLRFALLRPLWVGLATVVLV